MPEAVSQSTRQAYPQPIPGHDDTSRRRRVCTAEELTCFQIRTEASDTALARLVVLFGGRGARVRQLSWTLTHAGVGLVSAWVEVPPGRRENLARAISRLVDVVDVELVEPAQREIDER